MDMTPFVWNASDEPLVQILVSPNDLKQVILPGEKKKGGCNDWVIRPSPPKEGTDTPRWVLASGSKKEGVISRYVDQIVTTRHATELSDDSKSEITRRLFFGLATKKSNPAKCFFGFCIELMLSSLFWGPSDQAVNLR